MQETSPESRAILLATLFDLMEQSASIRVLEADRKERIKEKYRQAETDRIIAGIKMLRDDLANQDYLNTKAKNTFSKNINHKEQLKMQANQEKLEAEKQSEAILKKLEISGKKVAHKSRKLVWLIIFTIIVIAIVYYYR